MPDETSQAREVRLVDLGDDEQVILWSSKLGISPETLRQTVAVAGNDVATIARYLCRSPIGLLNAPIIPPERQPRPRKPT